ncbi:Hyccin [Trema orientale]|uniref:Hyccin n=1 Tax=Trema orientale TaxID=63057 RepID=A0A2P5FNK6_TREOI|nr:Hyccin [Trema orientale]
MDLGNSPSSSTTSSTTTTPNPAITAAATTTSDDPMHSWWESISKARSRIHSLSSILEHSSSSSLSLSSLADSDRPALSLLSSLDAYLSVSSALSSPLSGSGSDPLCHWLYDTFLSSDPHLRLVVCSFVPLLSGLYLSRIHSLPSDSPSLPSLAGFEAVLLALYAAETKARAGKPVVVSVPDLSQPSLYHTPRQRPNSSPGGGPSRNSVGVLAPPLEPQIAVKSTKRAAIVGVALDCYYKQISQMPAWSKLDFCRFAAAWAGQDCPCQEEFDGEPEITGFSEIRDLENGNRIDDVTEEITQLRIENGNDGGSSSNGDLGSKGSRIPLPWELFQPALRILGHCLLAPLNSQDVKDEAAFAVRRLYARASHDLVPQGILATRSLIQLDKRARADAKLAVAAANSSTSNANTPSKAKKPEILLVSK